MTPSTDIKKVHKVVTMSPPDLDPSVKVERAIEPMEEVEKVILDERDVGVTYLHLVNKISKDQLGRNMEVYVDDMFNKFKTFEDHSKDL